MPIVCVGSPLSKPGPLPGSNPFLAVMTGNNPEETPILRLSLGLYKLEVYTHTWPGEHDRTREAINEAWGVYDPEGPSSDHGRENDGKMQDS